MRHLLAWSVCLHVPAPSQKSSVHERPSLVQPVELDRLVQVLVDVAEAHHWHPFAGLAAAFVKHTPPMRQLFDRSVWVHVPAPSQASVVHERPSVAQVVALERLVQAVVLTLELHD